MPDAFPLAPSTGSSRRSKTADDHPTPSLGETPAQPITLGDLGQVARRSTRDSVSASSAAVLPMAVHVRALGCRLNEAELELWRREFSGHGHELLTSPENADVVVINTCAVTQEAVRKSRKLVAQTRRVNPDIRVVVTGCAVSLPDEEDVFSGKADRLGPDLIISNADKQQLVQRVSAAFGTPAGPTQTTHERAGYPFVRHRQRAFVKVQDGCRYRCTYCVVTLARGEEQSRKLTDIIDEVNALVEEGVQEVVLTGVHVGGYGEDLGADLASLVTTILADTDISRLRFASVEPWDLPADFAALFSNSRLMPHMHLPIQSGSDTVLKRMARRCKTTEFQQLVTELRAQVPDFNVTTDIITGFPGESETEWAQTIEFVQNLRFGHIHVFPFSARSGTKAARLGDQLPGDVRRHRAKTLQHIADNHKKAFMLEHVGRDFPVLWESVRAGTRSMPATRKRDKGHQSDVTSPEIDQHQEPGLDSVTGYTPNYLRVISYGGDVTGLVNSISGVHLAGIDEHTGHLLGSG